MVNTKWVVCLILIACTAKGFVQRPDVDPGAMPASPEGTEDFFRDYRPFA